LGREKKTSVRVYRTRRCHALQRAQKQARGAGEYSDYTHVPQIRELLATNDVLRRKIEAMEQRYDQKFRIVFDAIKKLISEDEAPRARIGFEDRK